MWSRPWRRRGKTAASRSMAGNHGDCGGQVIHSLPAAGLRGRLRSAMNNLGHGITVEPPTQKTGAQRPSQPRTTLTGADEPYTGKCDSRHDGSHHRASLTSELLITSTFA